MRKWLRLLAVLLIAGVIACWVAASSAADRNRDRAKDDLYRQVRLFADVLAIIQSDYVDETTPKDLMYGALKGMIASLDPHSQFMDPDTYNELKVDTEGKFGGLGIEITLKEGLLTVISPIEDTPAWKAGIKAGDRIVKINDEITRDMTLSEAVKRMRGKPGTAVTIYVLREQEKKILEFAIVRDVIKIRDIKEAKILEDGIGYIRLIEFRENTSHDLDAALEKLKKEGMQALILDLRNDPGGLLEQAVAVAGKFLERGKLIVSTKGRKTSKGIEFVSHAQGPWVNLPMAVLINAGSASGSEIVAGALQDYRRAIIVGTKSFGKGSVQTVIPLSDGSALRLTTSKYFTPSGKVIHGKGVIPDIVVEEGRIELVGKSEQDKDAAREIFAQVQQDTTDAKSAKPEDQKKDTVFDYQSDNQLMRAVDILKALRLYTPVPMNK